MRSVSISISDKSLSDVIHIQPSKSEWNRLLVMQALSGMPSKKEIPTLAPQDVRTLATLLSRKYKVYDCGPAGTCFRFLTAYLAIQPGVHILTGSERMKKRPIEPLVDALKKLGAEITYMEKIGFPPLRITGKKLIAQEVEIDGSTSSQFITALLLISPYMDKGLKIRIKGHLISRPYVEMTLKMMQEAGVDCRINEQVITIAQGNYHCEHIRPEPDWSSISYWYEIAAFSDIFDTKFPGFKSDSLQADSVLPEIYKNFGVETEFHEKGIVLKKKQGAKSIENFEYHFISCPDIAQTVGATCVGLGIKCTLTGLDNLNIKESKRIQVMHETLSPLDVAIQSSENTFSATPNSVTTWKEKTHTYDTYHDHRVAMSLAPLAMLCKGIELSDPKVVEKSYPGFWEDLEKGNFFINFKY